MYWIIMAHTRPIEDPPPDSALQYLEFLTLKGGDWALSEGVKEFLRKARKLTNQEIYEMLKERGYLESGVGITEFPEIDIARLFWKLLLIYGLPTWFPLSYWGDMKFVVSYRFGYEDCIFGVDERFCEIRVGIACWPKEWGGDSNDPPDRAKKVLEEFIELFLEFARSKMPSPYEGGMGWLLPALPEEGNREG